MASFTKEFGTWANFVPAWQQLELMWDRRLLTFGLGEQIDLVDGLVGRFAEVLELIHCDGSLCCRRCHDNNLAARSPQGPGRSCTAP